MTSAPLSLPSFLEQEFEAKGLGSFGGGPESKEAWRQRIESQDAYSAAAVAKATAMQAREQAVLTKRALLAQLEAAIPAVLAEEALASAAAVAAQEALKDLEVQAKASALPSLLCTQPHQGLGLQAQIQGLARHLFSQSYAA